MKKQLLLLSSAVALGATAASAQILHQWDFDDTAGTSHTAAVDSVASLTFSTNPNGAGNWTTNGAGLLTGGGGTIGNADIANVTTGIYQMDLTGVTLTALTGGTDDWGVFGMRSFNSSNITGFNGTNVSSANQAIIIFGNENNGSGLDLEIINNGTSTLVNDVTTDFSGTFDFRVVIDLDNGTADYLWQRNGGGFNTIVTQQANTATVIDGLALGGSTFSDTISIDQATFTAVPEPSTYALLAGGLALGVIMIRRRR